MCHTLRLFTHLRTEQTKADVERMWLQKKYNSILQHMKHFSHRNVDSIYEMDVTAKKITYKRLLDNLKEKGEYC